MSPTDASKQKTAGNRQEASDGGSNGPSGATSRERLQAQVKELEEKSQEALRRLQELSSKAQKRFEADLAEIRARRRELQERLEGVSKTADEDWKKIRGELDQAGNHVKNALDTVIERIKKTAKREDEETSKND